MSKKITDSESISEFKSKEKSKTQEVGKITVNSIKEILTSNGEDIILTDEQIQDIIDEKENSDGLDDNDKKAQYLNVRIIANCLRNLDRAKMKEYVHRKKEYLEKNRTISKKIFEELFGGSGKFGKAEINQGKPPLCKMYTSLEILKKTSGFDEMIQTSLKESKNGWELRLPFCDKNGTRIKVNKNEIDKEFSNGTSINSISKFLGFKILEIALLKKFIIDSKFSDELIFLDGEDWIKIKNQFDSTGNFELTSLKYTHILDLVHSFGYDMSIFLGDYAIQDEDISTELKDLAFDYYTKGLYEIYISGTGDQIISNVKIIYKNMDQFNKGSDKDIIIENNGRKSVKFYEGHAYSIEKCYIDKNTGEKRVRVINPRHTGIKYDISLEDCKSIFRSRKIVGIDIDKMFR